MADDVYISDETEDQTKATFDFWYEDGKQVSDLSILAAMTGQSRLETAVWISNYPYPDALPAGLFEAAQSELEQG